MKLVEIPKSSKFVGMKFNQGTHFESNEIVIVQGSCQVGGGLDQREECSRIAPPQNGNGIACKLFLPRKMENCAYVTQVDCMLEQLKTMEGNLARQLSNSIKFSQPLTSPDFMVTGNRNRLSKGDLRLPVHRMELGRIR